MVKRVAASVAILSRQCLLSCCPATALSAGGVRSAAASAFDCFALRYFVSA